MKKTRNPYNTVAVRFTSGGQTYTYKIRREVKLHLGQELVVEGFDGTSKIVWCVRIDKTPKVPPTYTMETLKEITRIIVEI